MSVHLPFRKSPLTQIAFAFILLLAAGTIAGPAQAQSGSAGSERTSSDAPFVRHPAVSPNGQQIAFSFQGDLWTVPSRGGRAVRLTVHEGYDGRPIWSPDGAQIAFTSDRYGNSDVYVMDADGGRPTRLTYHSTDDAATGFDGSDRVLFSTERTYVQAEWEFEIYGVSTEGGTPDRILDAVGHEATASPDGRFIAFRRGSNDAERVDYRGPANRDLWLYDTQAETYRQLTTFAGNDYNPVWTGDRELAFISARTGTYNVHRLTLGADGSPQGAPEALTQFSGDDVRSFTASADGSVLAVERGTSAYVINLGADASPERLEVRVPSDQRRLPVTRESYSGNAEEYAVSPSGDEVAFTVRGEVFVTETEPDDAATTRVTDHPFRDRDVAWLDDQSLVFASDRNGDQYDLYRLESDDPEAKSLFESLAFRVTRLTDTPENERNPVVSPDRSKIAFQRGSGELVVADVDDGALTGATTLLDGWAEAEDVAWSPDSRWLAYSRTNLNFNEDVFILAADGSEGPVNVSQHPRGDGEPVWSPDGSKLGFVSERSSGDVDVWFAWLRETDWERTQRDWKEIEQDESESSNDGTGENGDASGDAKPMTVDLDGIYQRLERVTALPGNEGRPVFSSDGNTIYFVSGLGSRTGDFDVESDLYKIKWDGSERERVTEGDVEPEHVRLVGGSHLYFLRKGGTLARTAAGNGSMEGLPFSARMTVDHDAEQRQIFQEAWRTLKRGFYDPDFHGVDWDSVRTAYADRVMQASTSQDFADLMNWMLGEVNASHMGYYRRSLFESESEVETGLLGVELDPVEDGVEVQRVVPRSPADREVSTLREGDVITAVNGRSVAEAGNVYRLLNGTAGERTLLEVRSPEGETRAVRIRPTDDLGDELYREWTEERAELVEEYSNGRLGYIHIEGMNWSSFERFEREIAARASGKEGLIVDVRYNGGGWTTDYLMTVLDVRRHAYTVPRGATDSLDARHRQFREHYPFGERRPFATWTKPVAALCNQNSYSNAEIFSHAFKQFDLGPLVGTPTFGAVISTGGRRLIDGSYVRLPFRGWYVYETDANMEGTPAVPDVTVENAPNAKALGQDAQLKRAVDELLNQIDAGTARGGRGSSSGSAGGR
jgi:tricorn protease